MSDQFVAEIRIFPFNFPPMGWAFCNGQLLPIAQNTALFSLLGTTYGGDGRTNFALPNLQGAAAMSSGQGPGLTLRDLGQTGGEATHTLTLAEMAAHTHALEVSNAAATSTSAGASSAIGASATNAFGAVYNMAPMGAAEGGGLAHNNLQPYLGLNLCIALQGIFPSRS